MSKNNERPKPFLKWVGGKKRLLPAIKKYVPANINTYYEPFVGAGAMFFDVAFKKAVINDINKELINCYKMIKNRQSNLVTQLELHKKNHSSEYFYEIREMDRRPEYDYLPNVERAARIIYLNKTCHGGLFRVNSKGEFNVPFGNYKNPQIFDIANLKAVSDCFANSHVKILNEDFSEAVKNAQKGDFVYFDPPYDPISTTSSFTGYSIGGFTKKDQERLKSIVDDLTDKNVNLLISNSSTKFIQELYQDYSIELINAPRNINSKAGCKKTATEVLISNSNRIKK